MGVLNSTMLKLFQILCIAAVLLLVFIQFQSYMENNDSSSVGYRKFNYEERDLYPAVSICLHSSSGSIFKEDEELFGLKGTEGGKLYQNMLLGNENITEEFAEIKYDNVTKNLLESYVNVIFTMTKQGELIDIWDSSSDNQNEEGPFFKSYQDPLFLCVTKRIQYTKNQVLNFATLVFNASDLYNSSIGTLLVYMHHSGQLTRQFGKQIFEVRKPDFKKAINGKDNYYKIHINQVDVLRKRNNGVVPCNDTLKNDDMVWREKVMEEVGCIPAYWVDLHPRINSHRDTTYLPECITSQQYWQIGQYYLPPRNTDNGTRLYVGPCDQMGITASVTQSDSGEGELVFGFSYVVEEYRETVNTRAFEFESLWSQIGGFIGMFLGCGLLQVNYLVSIVFTTSPKHCIGYLI